MFKQFCDNLSNYEKDFITIEVHPPHGASIKNIIDNIKKYNLLEKVSGFSCTDNPLSKLKMSSVMSAIKLQQTLDKPVIATMSMRDKNKLSLQSSLLGMNDFDLRCILALTGDPAKLSDQPDVKEVLERDSTLLLSIIYHLNQGKDYNHKALNPSPKPIYPFAVIDSFSKNIQNLKKRMVKKLDYGARAIFTQPVYETSLIKNLLEIFDEAKTLSSRETAKNAQLIIGQFPIVSVKTSNFINNNVPGIHVPKIIVDEMNLAHMDGKDKEEEVGFNISKNIFNEIMKEHGKTHLMTNNRFDLCSRLIG